MRCHHRDAVPLAVAQALDDRADQRIDQSGESELLTCGLFGDEGEGGARGLADAQGEGEGGQIILTPLVTTTARGSTLEIKPGFPSEDELVFLDVNNPGKLADKLDAALGLQGVIRQDVIDQET